jgi:hypothetical protein
MKFSTQEPRKRSSLCNSSTVFTWILGKTPYDFIQNRVVKAIKFNFIFQEQAVEEEIELSQESREETELSQEEEEVI